MITETQIQRELIIGYEPQFCPACSSEYKRKDVKKLESEHSKQVRWHCFCGYCGAIYTIEIEA